MKYHTTTCLAVLAATAVAAPFPAGVADVPGDGQGEWRAPDATVVKEA